MTAAARITVTAVFALERRASVTAVSMPKGVQAVLDRHEGETKAAMASPRALAPTIDVKALRTAERAARAATAAMSAEIDTVNDRISTLIASQRKREASWRRWFPDREIATALDALRAHRERLRASHSLLAHSQVSAEITAKRGAADRVRLDVKAAHERQAAVRQAEAKLAILSRARALLARVPALAYVGARNLLRMATRIERAREQGWDPGPSPTQIP